MTKTLSDLGLNVSRETLGKLERFASLFQKWARAINLVAPSTKESLWERHIADSAQIFKLAPESKHWIDLGSGGGFPGVITAILLSDQGDGWVDLVESNHKKAGFLRVALNETGARAAVHPIRIEEAQKKLVNCDAISARALADLDQLLVFAAPWAERNPSLRCYFHKGRDYLGEIDKARGRWHFDLVIHQSAIEADSVILELANIRRIGQPASGAE
ncbi:MULTISPECIES: 16S rRNA (guanine(527)-N(7))-methyltransferase RsmG [Alphaproteobacteria]|uniref:Ribosomal RNA small subunit methyltransferase G n=2 Tax=Alphaproteobacteria TaxID=28211 RepID=A0A512HMH9_9HYPH|nr:MULTISPECIES: 16S rRNA (guanine(527)-N(7))-methyltransferase RsmG [Alphaproteobacteria]GEO86600.1 ribosomal RNA small subunit methyltransferase G [Ciceribacter naphthalenivorans]GLR20828.1 ribosomal RNA small subunit methyltransferase G [Ciceribacter naphthalenivorans]GLT03684.1 ribosomal RNA small subunit methyltransferase G [Sphingomonas psychrolutea]